MSAKIISTWFFMRMPTRAAGMEPIIIYFRLAKKYFVWKRKKNKTENRLAVLRKMSKESEGLRPKKCWNRLRWPEEEIGRNSEIPWTKDKIIDWINVIFYCNSNKNKKGGHTGPPLQIQKLILTFWRLFLATGFASGADHTTLTNTRVDSKQTSPAKKRLEISFVNLFESARNG